MPALNRSLVVLFILQTVILIVYTGFEFRAGLILLLQAGWLSLGILLVISENSPLPYVQKVELPKLLLLTGGLTGYALALMALIALLEGKSLSFDFGLIASPFGFLDWLLLNMGIGISEESMKMAFVNILALIAGKAFPKRRVGTRTIRVFCVLAVLLWIQAHIGLKTGIELLGTLVTGLLWMYSVYKFRNYLPSVVAHTIFDLVSFLTI